MPSWRVVEIRMKRGWLSDALFGGPIAQLLQMILNRIKPANCRGGGYLNAT
ncbi:MAG: hypothetical protein RLZZ09_715 [Pseudomonadota bacterium]